MRSRRTPRITWAGLAALPADVMGPYRLEDGTVMERDPRSGLWVPAVLLESNWRPADGDNSWFDTQYSDSRSIDLTSLKSGWSIAVTGTGSVTGGYSPGGHPDPVLLRSPSGSTAALGYTIPARGANEHIALVIRCTPTGYAFAGSGVRLETGNSQLNKLAWYYYNLNVAQNSLWSGALSGLSSIGITTDCLMMFHQVTNGKWSVHLLSDAGERGVQNWMPSGNLTGAAASDYLIMRSVQAVVAANCDCLITSAAVYLGGL